MASTGSHYQRSNKTNSIHGRLTFASAAFVLALIRREVPLPEIRGEMLRLTGVCRDDLDRASAGSSDNTRPSISILASAEQSSTPKTLSPRPCQSLQGVRAEVWHSCRLVPIPESPPTPTLALVDPLQALQQTSQRRVSLSAMLLAKFRPCP